MSTGLECPTCKTYRLTPAKFCWQCGTKLVLGNIVCMNCRCQVKDTSDHFCRNCGAKADWVTID